ncbi:hypothetical protein MODO_3306 [Myroides odoratimimus]|nr:hypothetical protein MODO_3306 [Myroides odoratimimus]
MYIRKNWKYDIVIYWQYEKKFIFLGLLVLITEAFLEE